MEHQVQVEAKVSMVKMELVETTVKLELKVKQVIKVTLEQAELMELQD